MPRGDLLNAEWVPTPIKGQTLQDYLRILMKRRVAIIGVFLAVVASVALYSFRATPIYQATVRIMIERHLPRLANMRETMLFDHHSEEFYQTQYKLLESRILAKKVADRLKLDKNPHFAHLFKKISSENPEAQKRAQENLVDEVLGGIKVSPIRNSSLVDVSFTDPSPEFATQVVNTLAQSYIDLSLDLRYAASQEEAGWLQQKMTEARKRLEESEAKLNQYKKEQDIIALEDKETITQQKLAELNRELVAAQTRRLEAETRYKEIKQAKDIPQVLNHPLLQSLMAQEAKLLTEKSELSLKYGELHPRLHRLNQEIATIQGRIKALTSRVNQSITNEYNMAVAQEDNLKKALEEVKTETQDMSDRTIHYRVLLRDVETNRAIYENMLKSLKETTATENVPATNIRIINWARTPEAPISPRKMRNIALGAIMGLFLGCAIAIGLESLDNTLKTPEELESWLEIPSLGIIPHQEMAEDSLAEKSPELVVFNSNGDMASEGYRVLRTNILFSSPGRAPFSLLVTSALPAEGKTLTAVNLATAMAMGEPAVLLVDSDLRNPSLHKIFKVPADPGLSNYLVGETDELPVVPTVVPNLFLVPAGKIPPNPADLLGSDRLHDFLILAQKQFGRAILDSPPLLMLADASILATQVTGVLLVVKAGTVPRKSVREAMNQLLGVNAHLLGAVLNDVQPQGEGYYSYYRYHPYFADTEREIIN
ncbi:MAG: polysaccharide biosynthesis tyrosine autokinase [Thermodesulfobacteriota bacterium]